jgi:aminopeptidase N
VDSYEIDLAVDSGATSVRCRTAIRFSCQQSAETTFADLAAAQVDTIFLNGRQLSATEVWNGSRLTLAGLSTNNVLEVEALFPYSTQERGFRRATDSTDDSTYVYCMNFPGAAPRSFCCFDDPKLRAPVNLSMSAPAEWTCLSNERVNLRSTLGDRGRWTFATTAPIAPYLIAGATGPWSTLHASVMQTGNESVPVSVHAQRSREEAHQQGREIADLIARSVSFYESELSIPYPYGKCDAVFVRDFPSLAFSAPGLIMFDDKVLDAIAARGTLYAATVISHEVAHAWIGGLVDCGQDSWLVEAMATYLGRTAVAQLVPGSTPWSTSQLPAPPDAAYSRDAELVKNLEKKIGQDALFRGLHTFFRRFAYQDAGRSDLAACWSQASGHNLTTWAVDRSTAE